MTDPYQERYLAHQARKKRTLIEVMRARHSDRMFADRPVEPQTRAALLEVVDLAPSSCDSRGVSVRVVVTRDELALLGGLLLGGDGCVHRATLVLLQLESPLADQTGDGVDDRPL